MRSKAWCSGMGLVLPHVWGSLALRALHAGASAAQGYRGAHNLAM